MSETSSGVTYSTLRIVDVGGAFVPEDHVGRLQSRGATIMAGYHGNPEANAASVTDDGWLDTGDLASCTRAR